MVCHSHIPITKCTNVQQGERLREREEESNTQRDIYLSPDNQKMLWRERRRLIMTETDRQTDRERQRNKEMLWRERRRQRVTEDRQTDKKRATEKLGERWNFR